MIVLLLSLGLNVGLGVNLLRTGPAAPPAPREEVAAPEEMSPGQAQVERFMRHRLDRMARELDLDEQQRGALWSLHRDAGREVVDRRRAALEARARLREAYADPEAGAAAIHAAVRRLSSTQSDLDSLVVEVMLRERAILSPEQRHHYRSLFPMGPEQHPRRLLPGQGQGPRRGRQADR